MKLTFLMDNNVCWGMQAMKAQHGFSVLIEQGGKKILFDTGNSGLFLENARALGINLADVDAVVLSHSHSDHTGGLRALTEVFTAAGRASKPMLLLHPDAFFPCRLEGRQIGMAMTAEELAEHFTLMATREPFWLTGELCFLGEIPRVHDFEDVPGFGEKLVNGRWVPEDFTDDTALAYRSPEGVVVISGCAHSGICNITSRALELMGDDRLLDVIGGMHTLDDSSEKFKGTLRYMAGRRPSALHACHCTAFPCRASLRSVAPVFDAGAGASLTFS